MVSPQAGGGKASTDIKCNSPINVRPEWRLDWRKNLTRMLTGHTCIRSLNKILNNSYILGCKS